MMALWGWPAIGSAPVAHRALRGPDASRISALLDAWGFAPPAGTAPDPYAPRLSYVPSGSFGVLPVPTPSLAQTAGQAEVQAAQLAPSPYAAAEATAAGRAAAAAETMRALGLLQPAAVQSTPVDLGQFPTPAYAPPSMPERPSAAPSPLVLGAAALAGLVSGKWPSALATAQREGEQAAEQQYSDDLARWQTAVDAAKQDYAAKREARSEAIRAYEGNVAAADRAANEEARQRFDLSLRRAELGADQAGASETLSELGTLSGRARDYAVSKARAGVAERELESAEGRMAEEAKANQSLLTQRRMLAGSLLSAEGAERRADIGQQNADTRARSQEARQRYQDGVLAVRRLMLQSRASAPRVGGGRSETLRALELDARQSAAAVRSTTHDLNVHTGNASSDPSALPALMGAQAMAQDWAAKARAAYQAAAARSDAGGGGVKNVNRPQGSQPAGGIRLVYDKATGKLIRR